MRKIKILNRLSEVTDVISSCESILGNPAGFFGDDEEWDSICKEKESCEKEQNRLLKKLGYDRIQTIVDEYRIAFHENDFRKMNRLDPIIDACGVYWGINTVL